MNQQEGTFHLEKPLQWHRKAAAKSKARRRKQPAHPSCTRIQGFGLRTFGLRSSGCKILGFGLGAVKRSRAEGFGLRHKGCVF